MRTSYIFEYNDAMRAPACSMSHLLIFCADHMIHRNRMHITPILAPAMHRMTDHTICVINVNALPTSV